MDLSREGHTAGPGDGGYQADDRREVSTATRRGTTKVYMQDGSQLAANIKNFLRLIDFHKIRNHQHLLDAATDPCGYLGFT